MKKLLLLMSLFLYSCSSPLTIMGRVHSEGVTHTEGGTTFTCIVVEGDVFDVKEYTEKDKNCWCVSGVIVKWGTISVISVLASDRMCKESPPMRQYTLPEPTPENTLEVSEIYETLNVNR